ncbi:hypothetical protein QTN25_008128 [Entamoeba marina]
MNKQKVKSNLGNTLDSYSLLIVSKYFKEEKDYINVMCVCKKFQETTEKLRFNPIPIISMKLFPMIQTQYLYSNDDTKIDGIDNYEIWFIVDYDTYLKFKDKFNIKFHHIVYSQEDMEKYGKMLPKAVNMIADLCYAQTCIKTVTIPTNITSVGKNCYCYCYELSDVSLSTSLTNINEYCFSSCTSLQSIEIPTSILSFGYASFINCSSLQTITFPNSLTYIGDACFHECTSLKSITLPSSLNKLNNFVFYKCYSLTKIEFPTILNSIGDECFYECTSLTKITFPTSLQSIGISCFKGCINLLTIQGNKEIQLGKDCYCNCKKLQL